MAQIDWHSGYSGGFRLSMKDYKDDLIIEREHYITDEPTRMDHLIIKKNRSVVIDNSIGRAFRTYNVIEYKNPTAALNIDVVWKAIGYAALYKGYGKTVDAIPAKELTVTILRSAKPVKLFKDLMSEGYEVNETDSGVYMLAGFIDMPVQVVVIKELKDAVFRPLRIMIPGADEGEIRAFMHEVLEFENPEDLNNASAVLNVSSEANETTFTRIRRDGDMGEAMRRVMKDDLEKERSEGEQCGEQNAKAMDIKNLMSNMKWTIEQAMDALSIPPEQRSMYAGLIKGV